LTGKWVHAVGSRKTAVARVYIRPGKGVWEINGRPIQEYFHREGLVKACEAPLRVTGTEGSLDLKVNVKGGGQSGQAGAIRLAVARGLVKMDPERKDDLRKSGFLTRDPRMVERKKYGQPKARKRFQFSKR
jgi:small subunit ribosomal protein S9